MSNQLLRVLSIKPFLYLWLAEIFSQIAGNMVNFILLVLVFDLSSSNTAVSGIVLSFTIPAIIFGLLAGIIVDRSNKKKTLFITNFLRAVLLFLLAIFHSNLLFIYLFSFLISLITQFFIPAETPMIPHVVSKKQLFTANALFGMGIYGSILAGYALSGVFLIVFGSTYVFVVLAIFFIIASFFISRIKIKDGKKISEQNVIPSTFKREIKDAFLAVTETQKIYKALFLLSLSQILILVLSAVGPGFAKQVLEIEVTQFSIFIVAPSAIGMIIGALSIGNFFHSSKSKYKMVTIGLFVSSISILLLPFATKIASVSLHLVVVISFILGVANALVFVPSNTILQEETASHMRGKMYGLLSSFVGIFSLIPIILAGGLADLAGVPNVFIGIGVIIFIIGVIHAIFR